MTESYRGNSMGTWTGRAMVVMPAVAGFFCLMVVLLRLESPIAPVVLITGGPFVVLLCWRAMRTDVWIASDRVFIRGLIKDTNVDVEEIESISSVRFFTYSPMQPFIPVVCLGLKSGSKLKLWQSAIGGSKRDNPEANRQVQSWRALAEGGAIAHFDLSPDRLT